MRMTRKAFLVLLAAGQNLVRAITPKRWAMVVDCSKCQKAQGCTKCVDACHQAHNVPKISDRAHEVKWIWKERADKIFPETTQAAFRSEMLPIFCNHCDNPACVRVCPTKATWKREDGIVMMDWHRCIGCRYCVAACPFGSRSFNWVDPRPYLTAQNPDFPTRTKGVVEKCNFCEDRLADGKLPACVEACPEKAMTFGNRNDPNSPVAALLKGRYSIRRKPELGTNPEVYYLV
jgi:Fe-S-cluster-containing dehydrogenase component